MGYDEYRKEISRRIKMAGVEGKFLFRIESVHDIESLNAFIRLNFVAAVHYDIVDSELFKKYGSLLNAGGIYYNSGGHDVCILAEGCEGIIASGNSVVVAYENSNLTIFGNTQAELWDDCIISAYDESSVVAGNRVVIHAHNHAKVTVYGFSPVYGTGDNNCLAEAWMYDDSTVKVIAGSAIIHACDRSSVKAGADSKIDASDNSSVKAYGYAEVNASDKATVLTWDRAEVVARDSTLVELQDNVVAYVGDYCNVIAKNDSVVFAGGACKVRALDESHVHATQNAQIDIESNGVTVEATDDAVVRLVDEVCKSVVSKIDLQGRATLLDVRD